MYLVMYMDICNYLPLEITEGHFLAKYLDDPHAATVLSYRDSPKFRYFEP